jgi:hypothetical protein
MTQRHTHSGNERSGPRLTRRRLVGGALAVGLLAACGDDSTDDAAPGGTSDDGVDPTDGDTTDPETTGAAGASDDAGDAGPSGEVAAVGTYTLVQRFPQGLQVPGQLRLPLSLSTGAAELITDGPDELGAQVVDIDGNPIGERISAVRRDTEPAPYYDFHPTVDDEGFFALVVDGGPEDGASFQVANPADVPVPIPGSALPPFDTPTVDDARGVDPICTREPEPCPFHEVTLTEALATGKPVAYYVGTPAFCSTGSCAPALESLIEVQDEFGDAFTFVHAEVYTDLTATEATGAVEAAGMFYEPALFVTDAEGTVVERLDAVWDTSELVEVLRRVSG